MNLRDSLVTAALCVAGLWVVWLVDLLLPFVDFAEYGIVPRETSGLVGIAVSPLVHSGRYHLAANSGPVFVLAALTLYFYRGVAFLALPFIYLASGLLVWLFARTAFHIGASGIIYGLAAFLFFSGVFRRRWLPLFLSILVVALYGGLVWGVLPLYPGVSWESHLFGAVSGGAGAYLFRRIDRNGV